MTIELFELCGTDPDIRFSPHVWPTRMALAHKGLSYKGVPWRFTEKDAIAFSGQGQVPVIRDGDRTVTDSWAIALYLEDTYPDAPSLFGGPGGRASAALIRQWALRSVFAGCAPLAILPVWSLLDDTDKAYFRETREKRFGKALEDVQGDKDARVQALRAALDPLRATLGDQPFIGGDAPLYHDYMVFGPLQWLRCVTGMAPFEADDPVRDWMERLLDAHGGMARAAKTVEAA
jgi:glutathione S-transferase